jgi:hypothetical protein
MFKALAHGMGSRVRAPPRPVSVGRAGETEGRAELRPSGDGNLQHDASGGSADAILAPEALFVKSIAQSMTQALA